MSGEAGRVVNAGLDGPVGWGERQVQDREAETPTASAKPDERGLEPRAILLRQLLRQQPSLALINASVALAFALFAAGHAPPVIVGGWLALALATQVARLALTWHWLRRAVEPADLPDLGRRLTWSSFLAGTTWGAMGWLFINLDPVVFDVLVAFVIAGMAAGAITALPAHPPAFAAFLLPTLLPMALVLALDERPQTAVMVPLTIGYALGILYLGRHSYRTQLANAGLYLENEALVASLREAGQKLEARVAERTLQLETLNTRLASANEQMVGEINKRRRSEAQVRHLLHHDPLTNLPNRLVLADRLETALRRARREATMVAVVLFDIDRFKAVNDTFGHVAADAVLRALAGRLQPSLRASDTLARMGGDEFAAIFPDIHSATDIAPLAEKLIEHTRTPFVVEGRSITVTLSIGAALFPLHGADAATLLSGADLALYDAKQRGRARFSLLTADMLHRSRAQRQIEQELVGAVGRGEFRIVYQPQVSLRRSHVIGAEALVRWAHPRHGLLSPGAFIPAAEATGLVREIDHWVIATACRQAALWQGHGRPVRVAVNLSPLEFRQPGLAVRIGEHLATAELDPSLLEIEITESAYLDRETSSVDEQLHAIKALGARIAIDDFGTGYASLSYLRWLPVDVVKIDRSFVSGIAESRNDQAIVASTVSLAATLGKTVIAEGVETTTQLEVLERLGCDEVQGYLFGRPASERRLRERLAA
jgi:diguanylate cyclase (GGDEF)-like protein